MDDTQPAASEDTTAAAVMQAVGRLLKPVKILIAVVVVLVVALGGSLLEYKGSEDADDRAAEEDRITRSVESCGQYNVDRDRERDGISSDAEADVAAFVDAVGVIVTDSVEGQAILHKVQQTYADTKHVEANKRIDAIKNRDCSRRCVIAQFDPTIDNCPPPEKS